MAPGGRSTGCKTCRMRHLKCDERRPSCHRCEKAGLDCRGYDVIDVFVDERSRILERESRPKAERRRPGDLKLSHRSKSATTRPEERDASLSKPFSSAIIAPEDKHQSVRGHHRAVSPLTISPSLYEDEIYLNFMQHKLLVRLPGYKIEGNGGVAWAPLADRMGWLWPALFRNPMQSPLAPAVSALTRAWFAKIQGHPAVAAQGMAHYGKALGELKLALSNGRWRERDVLVSAMCLILYEAVQLTDHDAWINHARGLAQLIEAQGPECFQDPVGVTILRAMRYAMIMSAMALNVPIFLERKEWRDVPWEARPSSKRDVDRLFDIFAQTPGLLCRIREWEQDRSIKPEPIHEDVLGCFHEICQWRWRFEMLHPNCAWIEDLYGEEPFSMFPCVLGFSTFYHVHAVGIYNSLMVLYIWICRRITDHKITDEEMVPPLPDGLVKSNPLILPGVDRLDVTAMAREICQTIRFRMNYMSDNTVAFGLFLPLRTAWQALRDNPEEVQWLNDTSAKFEHLSGLQLPKLSFWNFQSQHCQSSSPPSDHGSNSC